MYGFNLGSVDRRLLIVRLFIPLRVLPEPLNIWGRRWQHGSHRCYCPEGRMTDGGVSLCGVKIAWWYSHYWGRVPCVCDTVVDAALTR